MNVTLFSDSVKLAMKGYQYKGQAEVYHEIFNRDDASDDLKMYCALSAIDADTKAIQCLTEALEQIKDELKDEP